MMRRCLRLFLALLLITPFSMGDDLLPSKTDYVTFEPISPVTVAAGKPTEVELHFRVGNGYHINSNKPSSNLLIPTTLKLLPPTDIMAGKIIYPPGKDLSLPFSPEEKLNVYTEDFAVKALLTATRSAFRGKFTIHGQLHYQACDDHACFPPKTAPLQFDVNVVNRLPRTYSGHGGGQSPHIHR